MQRQWSVCEASCCLVTVSPRQHPCVCLCVMVTAVGVCAMSAATVSKNGCSCGSWTGSPDPAHPSPWLRSSSASPPPPTSFRMMDEDGSRRLVGCSSAGGGGEPGEADDEEGAQNELEFVQLLSREDFPTRQSL